MGTEIQASLIIEVIGRPPEHLNETLDDLITKMGAEKGVKITSKKINEPVLLKGQENFYTNFAEVELEVEELSILSMIAFKYMPAHMEIISPERINISNGDMMDILNEILRKMHGYDEIARMVQNEKMILENQVKLLIEKNKSVKK